MIALIRKYDVLEGGMPRCLRQHEDDQILAFEKKGCVFVFNFHPTRSQTGLFVPVPEKGDYQVILSRTTRRSAATRTSINPLSTIRGRMTRRWATAL